MYLIEEIFRGARSKSKRDGGVRSTAIDAPAAPRLSLLPNGVVWHFAGTLLNGGRWCAYNGSCPPRRHLRRMRFPCCPIGTMSE